MSPSDTAKSKSEKSKEAFEEIVQALSRDMPMVMHGSGEPAEVDPQSVRLLSELTANYIGNLVEAAVDAHAILNDGPKPLPPPPFSRVVPSKPPHPDSEEAASKKRRRVVDDFWDEPLKEPKIKNEIDAATGDTTMEETGGTNEEVPEEEWVGVSGVDFWETSRARKAYVGSPAAIGSPSFIFPICHDPGLYGRVIEVQRIARRSIAPILEDPVVKAVLAEEGAKTGPGALRKRESKVKKGGEGAEPVETDSEDEDGNKAAWPGLDSMLPVRMLKDLNRTAK
eukprot:scaffold1965_cov110-Cylindrotheca_fusiformis.AAC.8